MITTWRVRALIVTATLACAPAPPGGSVSPAHIERGVLPATWYAGRATCATQPPQFKVHAYNDDFFILRQPACTNYEKPFLYLVFGRGKVLLLDTGAGKIDVPAAVDGVIKGWLARHNRQSIPLVVAHSHSHGDHVAGDTLFRDKPNVTLVGRDTAAVRTFFGITQWPGQIVQYDLGDRVLDVIPIPGHQPASIALYDRRTGILLSGDTFYPGRLYVRDQPAFIASIKRLVEFTRTRPISYILGTHIEEKSTPFEDYVVGTVDQPNEHVLQLSRGQLLELDAALDAMQGKLVRKGLADFTIWPQ